MIDRDPLDRSPVRPSGTAPNLIEMIGTDLPLPRRGSSGITLEHVERLLDVSLDAVPAPPLHDTSRAAVYQWLRQVQEGLWSRREQRWLGRQVAQVLFDEWTTADWVERTRSAIRHRAQTDQQKRDGTYWAGKDARRRARRPARFCVDDQTWDRQRRAVHSAGVTLGGHLGAILTREAERLASGGVPRTAAPVASGPARFMRVDIADPDWAQLKLTAARSKTTVIGYISEAVRQAHRRR